MSYKEYYPNGWQSGEAGGTPITPDALRHIEKGVKNALPKDGTDPMTANLPMGGHKVTGLGEPVTDGDAVPLGYANKHFTPAGLADYTPYNGRGNFITNLLHIDFDNKDIYCNKASVVATEDASELIDSPITGGPFYAYREVLFIDNPTGGLPKCIVRLTQAYPFQRNIWINIYDPDIGFWSGWEWENPPMYLGIEYRTTRRHNGKTIYAKRFDCGTLPNSSYKDISVADNVTEIVWHNIVATGSDAQQLPIINYSTSTALAWSSVIGNAIRIQAPAADASGYTGTIHAEYTKD